MFGNNVTSSWANPQQNQQQPASGSAFGQPNAFGNTGAFGSAGAFGQPQQQQQGNPMFGNLGGTSNTAPTSGFGAFGGATSNQTPSAFGAPKPATGFGAFGGAATNTFGGGGNAFGTTPNSNAGTSGTSLFGQANNTSTSGAFGGGGLFGANKTTGFGTNTTTNPQNAPIDGVTPVTTGSSNPPYAAFTDKEQSNNGSSVTLHYQSISCMPAYRGTSFEELRFQDYAQGRKTAGAFGQSAAFGATTTQPATNVFGQPQPQQTTTTNAFGQNTSTPSAFGAFSATNNQPAQPTNSLFGGTSAFGQPAQQPAQQPSAFGVFGQPAQQQQPQQQQPAGGIFGGGSAFGQPKPAGTGFGGFGGGGAFGSTNTTNNAFGQPQQQQQQQQPSTGLFGQAQTNPTPSAFGGFGTNNNNNATKPLFGAAPSAPSAFGGGGIFGQNQQQNQQAQQPQPQQQTSLFGGFGANNNNAQQPQQNAQQPATNAFGAPAAQPAAATGLFGGGGGLFGNNQQQQQQQNAPAATATNPFGGANSLFAKPAAPANNLFGGFGQQNTNNTAAQAPSTGLFGSTLGQSTNQQPALGNSLFGKPAAPALGSTLSTAGAPAGGSLFGSLAPSSSFSATATAPGAAGTLTASIAEPIGNNLPIFSMLPPGPRSINLDLQPSKKKAGFFTDIPTRSPVPRVQLGYTPATSKLRGFASSTTTSTTGNPFASVSFLSGKAGALSISRADNKTPVGSESLLRSQSPALGGGQRQSVKKLIIDKKVEPIDLFSKSGASPARIGGSKVTFNPALSVAAREKEAAATAAAISSSQAQSTSRDQRTPSRLEVNNSVSRNAESTAVVQTESTRLEDGDYWCKPDLDTLKRAGFQELSAFSGLVVGRKNYGEIQFMEPVDLTGLPKLGALLGDVVRFDEKECSVYPDIDDVDKPPPGSGLNVKAKVTLERCWATDKATREPIKDEKHPSAVKHLKRLRNMKDTTFESFEIKDGKWTFTVDHF
ncbi:hypothetical protein ONZ45_g4906 [Pleurotus djamor]|nr:hypothetical protein ONZ45_g4906 [Pleurotus djamor]